MLSWIVIGLAALIVLIGLLKWVFRIGKVLVVLGALVLLGAFALNSTDRGRELAESVKEGVRQGYERASR